MSNFNENDLQHLEKLCRIKVSQEEEKILFANMTKIIGYIDKLQEINTDNVEPLSHPIESMQAPLREDQPGFMIETKEFLKSSPDHLGSMIKVAHIMTQEAQDA